MTKEAQEVERIEGLIDELYMNPTKTGKPRWSMKIQKTQIDGWAKDIPPQIAKAMEDGQRINVGFTTSAYGGKDYYTIARAEDGTLDFYPVSAKMPPKEAPKPGALYPQQEEKITAKPNAPQQRSAEYGTADKFKGLGALTQQASELLDASREAFKIVYGHYPENEAEMASVNTVFIFLSKHWAAERWLRGNQGMTIEEHLTQKRTTAPLAEGGGNGY